MYNEHTLPLFEELNLLQIRDIQSSLKQIHVQSNSKPTTTSINTTKH